MTPFSLKPGVHLLFRPNFEQGILGECFIPLIFHYVLGTFNEDWAPCQNLVLAHIVIFLGYFRFQNFVESSLPFWALAYTLQIYLFWTKAITIYQFIHFVVLTLNIEIIPRVLPKQFSVSELFMYSSTNAFYFSFAFDSLIYRSQRQYIAGCNISNVLIFTPWVFLNFSGLIHVLIGKYVGVLSLFLGLIVTFVSISPYNEIEIIFTFLKEVLTKEIEIFGYMAIVLALGFLVI